MARICTIEGCDGEHKSRGYCPKHYQQIRKFGEIQPDRVKHEGCKVEGCDGEHLAFGYCRPHYSRHTRSKKPLTAPFTERFKAGDREKWIDTVALNHRDNDCLNWPFGSFNNHPKPVDLPMQPQRIVLLRTLGEPDSYSTASTSCGNSICMNPAHLEWVPVKGNAGGTTVEGEDAWNCKLTEEEVLAIVADPRFGKDIAKDYGVKIGAVQHIKQGRTWSWLTGIPNPKYAGRKVRVAG